MASVICEECGDEFPERYEYCPYCGEELIEKSTGCLGCLLSSTVVLLAGGFGGIITSWL